MSCCTLSAGVLWGVFVPVGVVEFFGALFDVFVHVWDLGHVGGLHGGVVPLCGGFVVVF